MGYEDSRSEMGFRKTSLNNSCIVKEQDREGKVCFFFFFQNLIELSVGAEDEREDVQYFDSDHAAHLIPNKQRKKKKDRVSVSQETYYNIKKCK